MIQLLNFFLKYLSYANFILRVKTLKLIILNLFIFIVIKFENKLLFRNFSFLLTIKQL